MSTRRNLAESGFTASTSERLAWTAALVALISAVLSLGGAFWSAHTSARARARVAETIGRPAYKIIDKPISETIASMNELTLSMEGRSQEQIRKSVLVSILRSFTGVYMTLISIIQGAVFWIRRHLSHATLDELRPVPVDPCLGYWPIFRRGLARVCIHVSSIFLGSGY